MSCTARLSAGERQGRLLCSRRAISVLQGDIHEEVGGLISREKALVADVQAGQADTHGVSRQEGCVESI